MTKLKLNLFSKVFFILFLFGVNYKLSKIILNYSISVLNSKNIIVLTLKPFESITILLTLDLYLTIIMMLPFILFSYYLEYRDALYSIERKVFYNLFKTLFFGMIFASIGYLVTLHYTVPLLIQYNTVLLVQNSIGFYNIFVFLIQQSFIFFFISLIPTIVRIFLNLNIITKSKLKLYRKHVFVFFLIFSAIITPADIFTTIFFTFPMYILFEYSIY